MGTRVLKDILDAVAEGVFPAPDGTLTVVPQTDARDAGILAFTAHTVVVTDEPEEWVRQTLAAVDCDRFAAPMNARFLTAFMDRTGRTHETIDLVTVAPALPGPPPVALREIRDRAHPRVARALAHRDDVRVWEADGGVLTLGRGLGGRLEASVEVDEEVRHRGLGRQLALSARHLAPEGYVWAQQSPGNARSVRVFQAAGYRAVGSEALMLAL
ncbi:GNAT family N-acetyltransferase [Streptomyces sp. SID8379]|uniref:GNAT family N-acetyltransferase n=1 Tax=unclassified Streptomyces TaxID=2593676 RepID=UPI00035FB0C6|nr:MULTISPECIES: GNAT family N-acetyltransferase [unclassified Streptomyces]MYW63639.1 GNAT family N-acetyltransferase [Streptomyces sp. SID8379]